MFKLRLKNILIVFLDVVRKIKIDDSNRRVHLREDRTGQVEHVKTLTLKERNELCEKFNFALIPTVTRKEKIKNIDFILFLICLYFRQII